DQLLEVLLGGRRLTREAVEVLVRTPGERALQDRHDRDDDGREPEHHRRVRADRLERTVVDLAERQRPQRDDARLGRSHRRHLAGRPVLAVGRRRLTAVARDLRHRAPALLRAGGGWGGCGPALRTRCPLPVPAVLGVLTVVPVLAGLPGLPVLPVLVGPARPLVRSAAPPRGGSLAPGAAADRVVLPL